MTDTSAASRPVFLLLSATIKPGKEEEIDALLAGILPVTRGIEACLSLSAYRKLDGSRKFLIAEKWASMDDYKKYVEWRQSTGDLDTLISLLEAPPELEVWPLEL